MIFDEKSYLAIPIHDSNETVKLDFIVGKRSLWKRLSLYLRRKISRSRTIPDDIEDID